MTAIEPAAVDAAWVSVDAPLTVSQLAEFCRDLERLYRINPYLEFRHWRKAGEGRYAAAWRNGSNARDFAFELAVERNSDCDFTVRYDRGIKRATRFRIEPSPAGSRLIVTDDYSGAATPDALDAGEIDRSLHGWGMALHQYLQREARWSRYAAWRWYMRRVWLPMKPAARRITFMLLIITAAEIAVIALVMAVYWAEQVR
ncbi:MAG TPA: hypothetical protein VNT02_07390 [Burkholderiales bacterium]|nr:hypothetical protein [Burkholderiales bacterium]